MGVTFPMLSAVLVLCVVSQSVAQSYLEKYGPGSSNRNPTPAPSRTGSQYDTGPDRYNPSPSRDGGRHNSGPSPSRDGGRYNAGNANRYESPQAPSDRNRNGNNDRYGNDNNRYNENNNGRYDDNNRQGDNNRYNENNRYNDNNKNQDNSRYGGSNRGPHNPNPRPGGGGTDYRPRPDTRPRPGPGGNDRYEPNQPNKPVKPSRCPTTLEQWERDMDVCLSPLTRLQGRNAQMRDKCRAYFEAEPCVEGMKLCKRDNPRIMYFKSKAIDKWKAMEREAEVFGLCKPFEQ